MLNKKITKTFTKFPFSSFGRIFLRALIALGALTFLATPTMAALTLKAEVNPDPAEPEEMIDVQISVSSTSTTGALTLRLPWPAELGSFPSVTGGGGCSGSCSPGEFLVWNLGTLGPGGSVTVGFNENVLFSATDGEEISLAFELLEGASTSATLTETVVVQSDSPLEINVDPKADPISPGGTLVYEVVYGNTSAASAGSAELRFPIPAGTQFRSATGGGVFVGGTVTWNLGSLPPGSGGRERVTVDVDALSNGSLLTVDTASLSGVVNFQTRESRAMAVSRVDSAAVLDFALEADPDPAETEEMIDVQISIANNTAVSTGSLSLRVLWPEHLGSFPFVTGGGGCSGSCSPGESLVWSLGPLGPGAALSFGFNEEVSFSVASGTLIPLEIELFEDGQPAGVRSRTVLVRSGSPLEVVVDPLTDPVAPGATLIYEIAYGNTGTAAAEDAELRFPIPEGAQFISATGGGVHSGGVVSWSLGDFPSASGGWQRVAVAAGLGDTSLLVVDAATFTGLVNFQPRESRATAISRVDPTAGPILAVEVNPDPAEPEEMIDAQITVTNPTASTTGSLTLRVLWPEHLNSFPNVTGGGGCSGSCSAGESLFWSLGPLGPGASFSLGFSEELSFSAVSGTLIPLEIELFEGGLPIRTKSPTVLVNDASPLEITVDPLLDPIAPGGTLVYEIVYGNAGLSNAAGAELRFPIPAGSQFVTSTGGQLVGGVVRWNLGNLPVGSGARQRVTVAAAASPSATLLGVDRASLTANVNFQPQASRAMAVSRVASSPLQLTSTVMPNPVRPDELLSGAVTVTNPTGSVTGSLTLRLLWPEHLQSFPTTTGGGGCSGSCSAGEQLVWSLGPLGPGISTQVSFNEDVVFSTVDGTVIPLELELLEAGLPVRNVSHSVLVHPFIDADGDGEGDVWDLDDDNDGMPDWWEQLHGLNPLNAADASQDPDMDGATNLQEFLAGTDPNVIGILLFEDGFESGNTSVWSNTVL